jgi:hypothetical protein
VVRVRHGRSRWLFLLRAFSEGISINISQSTHKLIHLYLLSKRCIEGHFSPCDFRSDRPYFAISFAMFQIPILRSRLWWKGRHRWRKGLPESSWSSIMEWERGALDTSPRRVALTRCSSLLSVGLTSFPRRCRKLVYYRRAPGKRGKGNNVVFSNSSRR